MEKLDLAPKRGLRSGSDTCQRLDCVELLTCVLAHRGKENPAKMQSKVHELSHVSSCFIYLPALFLSAFPPLTLCTNGTEVQCPFEAQSLRLPCGVVKSHIIPLFYTCV